MDETNNKETIVSDDASALKSDTANSTTKENSTNNVNTGKSKILGFLKKNGFYLGLGILIVILAVVLIFDGNRTLKGDIPYESTVFIVGDNSISLIRYNEEPIMLTSSLFKDYEDQKLGLEAHNGILLSKDEEKIMYVDNLHLVNNEDLSSSRLVGTLWLFDGVNNIKIAEESSFYYVVNDAFDTVLYKTYKVSEDASRLVTDLYKYELSTKQSLLIREDMDTDIFSLSNDGKVCVFLDDLTESHVENGEPTYSLFIYENNQIKLIAENVYDLNASAFTGNADVNYPIISKNGDKIIYATINYVYMFDEDEEKEESVNDEEEKITVYPTFDMYLYQNETSKLIAKSCAQLIVSYDFSQIIYIDDVVNHLSRYDEIGFAGTYSHYDVETGVKTIIMEDVFGFIERNVLGYADNDFINANFYFKNYVFETNTAQLYTMKNGKEILIDDEASVGSDEDLKIDFVSFSPDYKDVYVFKTYISKTSSLLYRYTIKSNGSINEYMCEEKYVINGIKLSQDGKYLVYNAEGRLTIIFPGNIKKTIEREGVSSFDITAGGRYVYYYKETDIGVGAVYYYDLAENKESVRFINRVNEIWNYHGDMVMLRMNTNYNTMTGDLYLSDFEQFEYISPTVYSQIKTKVTER
ncbi:MAG TPA: hypothetical protein PLT91_00925 [Clostridia bacterium]|jgi:hypothetical protein|nr:MAG: hypothetical protein BWX97_00727 [Firmicutes bacterium ADurb.Bin146]HOD92428.1 hypothetical protein [Clostridia bacterium]HQM38785.1 hypothetical protein [Clostridia bacterium]